MELVLTENQLKHLLSRCIGRYLLESDNNFIMLIGKQYLLHETLHIKHHLENK